MLRKPKYPKSKPKKVSLTAKLDKVFSEYIRLRDTREDGTFTCISCNRILPYDQADCGHYINRKHMSTRFSEKNCNAQCRSCNRFDEGNIQGYRRGLIAKYGEPIVVMLESMKNQINKISEFEYNAMIDHYRKEVKRLKREKGIWVKKPIRKSNATVETASVPALWRTLWLSVQNTDIRNP